MNEIKPFQSQPIRQEQTVGELLLHARQTKSADRSKIASHLKIPDRHLDSLERGRYNDLPSPVYIKNYLKLYAKALGIAWERIGPLYEQEVQMYYGVPKLPHEQAEQLVQQRRKLAPSKMHERRPLIIPRLIVMGFWAVVVFLLVLYFVWEIVQFISPPELLVTNPSADTIVSVPELDIVGRTEPESIVEVNGQTTSVNPDGSFTETLYLQEGLNTVVITSRTKRSQERVEVRNVLYKKE